MLEDQIRRLDDDAAVRILEAVAGARLHAEEGAFQTELTPGLSRALREEFAVGTGDAGASGRGDVARAGLLVLAADPEQRPALDAFVRNPSAATQPMALLEAAGATALIVAALVALPDPGEDPTRQGGHARLDDREETDRPLAPQAARGEAAHAHQMSRPRSNRPRLIFTGEDEERSVPSPGVVGWPSPTEARAPRTEPGRRLLMNMWRIVATIAIGWTWAAGVGAIGAEDERPNVVIIMADDMGFSDIGCYGGEILTSNLDALASDGLRFTQFYNAGRCCPTRATLLTGLYAHQAGVGHMMEDDHEPGYRGDLNRSSVTIAEALRPAGYSTLMSGKWHVCRPERADENGPTARGFDRYYGIIHGGFQLLRSRHADPRRQEHRPARGGGLLPHRRDHRLRRPVHQ